jgi:aminopeptidase N
MIGSQLRRSVACLFLLIAASTWSQRLPDTVVPEHYTLLLTPDLKNATFTGSEKIDVLVRQKTDSITLNAAEIKFATVSAEVNGQTLKATVTEDDAKQQATFKFEKLLPAGRVPLAIEYSGILNNELRGFYLSKTAKRNYAVTQFEPTDARRAFPCFDEPAFKATFDVSLVVDKGDTAISNTSIASDTPGPLVGEHTIRFATTPKMSTYLVAFLVGDFQCLSGESNGTPIRACATPDKVQLGSFALSTAEFVLHYYNNYFGIPYPMPKLDMIALPDFEAGAMENFGAITYRETAMLVDEKTASLDAKKLVATDIAHEMAHQWFGDMVTMRWWDNLWLNEGFATWMENKPIAAWKPDWHISEDVIAAQNRTLDYDAQRVTRPIRAKADTPDEINEMFDGIAYGKAAAVLLMVENYEGEETFRQGVHNYLQAHMFSNATAEDFWNAQAEVSHRPVDKILSSFVAEPGVPLLTFAEPSNGVVQGTQQRFFLNPDAKADPQIWSIPVCFSGRGETCSVLDAGQGTMKADGGSGFFFPDAEGKGYYRFVVPGDVYSKLMSEGETVLSPEERIMLLGDEWADVRANKSPIGDYLSLVTAVKDDDGAAVIATAVSPLSWICRELVNTPEEQQALAGWVMRTFQRSYQQLGPPKADDSPNRRALRATLLATLGNIGQDREVISEAKTLADRYLRDPASVDPTLAQAAAVVAAIHGDAAFFDRLQQVFETGSNPQIQQYALQLLAYFQDPDLERRSLEYAVSGKVRNQDAVFELTIPMYRPVTREVAWDFVRQNWAKVQAQLTTQLGGYLVESAGNFCSDQKRQEVADFFSTHKVVAAERALARAQSQIGDCIELRRDQQSKLNAWIASQNGE